MGKLKNAIINEQEAQFNAIEKTFDKRVLSSVPLVSREEWVSYGMANQQDWAECTKEFEAWLDSYEASFGDRGEFL